MRGPGNGRVTMYTAAWLLLGHGVTFGPYLTELQLRLVDRGLLK